MYSTEEKLEALQNINRDNLDVSIQYNGTVCGSIMKYITFKSTSPKELLKNSKQYFKQIQTNKIKKFEVYKTPCIEIDEELIHISLGFLELNNGENIEDYIAFRADYSCETDEEFDPVIKNL